MIIVNRNDKEKIKKKLQELYKAQREIKIEMAKLLNFMNCNNSEVCSNKLREYLKEFTNNSKKIKWLNNLLVDKN